MVNSDICFSLIQEYPQVPDEADTFSEIHVSETRARAQWGECRDVDFLVVRDRKTQHAPVENPRLFRTRSF